MFQQLTSLFFYGGPGSTALEGEEFMSVLNFVLSLAGPLSTVFGLVRPSQQTQAYDDGVSIVVQVTDSNGVPVNLRPATKLKMLVTRPSGVAVELAAVFYTNGFDGKMSITTSDINPTGTGLDEFGTWQVQGKLTLDGATQYTAVGAFLVNPNLGA